MWTNDSDVVPSIDGEVVMSIDVEVLMSIDVDVVMSVDLVVVMSINVEVLPSVDVEVASSVHASSTMLSSLDTCCSSLIKLSSSFTGIIFSSSNDAKNLFHLSFSPFFELIQHHQEICKGRLFQCHPKWLKILVAVD